MARASHLRVERSPDAARRLLLVLPTPAPGPINPGQSPDPLRRTPVADSIREKIENAGEKAKDAAQKAGEKVKKGAETAAEKTAATANAVGERMKDAGQKLKDKSGA
jgi:hypothetical protein